ncbi:MAG: gliding motility-associated C-terminal domain-containing protein [Flavobacteriales bacterium]|nr:gliding motility-associated C-terminal domain-containing protein [Flavobacteriales bacterium]MBP7154366.1 gliding motility-associated C-terminal domain-containing protein [Flavobacteriales bacterium]HQV75336.1 gliding motility-associated C-terminal domain-containing protein [Flavobacteriales bacterium]HQW39691.1 gliding motility-associated C-terminal domain-containing protein [Flavobacteriales bacterium]
MTNSANSPLFEMKRSSIILCAVLVALCLPFTGIAQTVMMSPADYDAAKLNGSLPEGAQPILAPVPDGTRPSLRGGEERGGGNSCGCWVEPDDTYTLAMQPNDDGSSDLINLPFSFDLYGESYNTVYINNNGNVSFVQAFGTYSSTGFPNANNKMVAPFWADIDTRGIGQVLYKITPTAMYVNWIDVGYFSSQTDKVNNFQLIITDGTDLVIGTDKNVSFCYKDMQWTTGSASQGVNGFGGTPSTVGANRGDGVDFIQFTRNDQPGNAYDGPFDLPDGVDWLDNKFFLFTTSTSTQNIPPIATGLYLCDTLVACIGQTASLEVTFLSPENGQTTTATSTAPGIPDWVETNNVAGIAASVTGQFTPTAVGTYIVTFTGTDDGVPPLTTTVDIIIEIVPPPTEPPTISGPTVFCTGNPITLTADGVFDNFIWSTGQTGQSIQVSTPGDYTVSAGTDLCQLASLPFSVFEITPPPLEIVGEAIFCGEPFPVLEASPGYESYLWSNNSTDISTTVDAGTYTVTGAYQGCTNTSQPFTVTNVDPGPPVFTGNLQFCEGGSTTLSFDPAAYDFFFFSDGGSSPSVVLDSSQTISVSAFYLNCAYETQVTVEEVVLPPVAVTGDTLYCGTALANLQATLGFDTYTWNNNAFGQTINVTAGTYFVTASIGPCSTFSNTFTVSEAPAPMPVIIGPTASCSGNELVLTVDQPYASYLWSNGDTDQSTSVLSGTYTVTVSTVDGCTGTSAPHVVVVGNTPTAGINADPASPQPPNTSVLFTDDSNGNGSQIVQYTWILDLLGDSTISGSGTNISNTYDVPGTYAVTLIVTTAEGCSDTTAIAYVIRPPEVIVYNVFSPNNSGGNETFVIENGQYYNNELTVFNRWGQSVFDATNYKNNWRATDVPDGTYYYVFKIPEDGREYTGHVTILR